MFPFGTIVLARFPFIDLFGDKRRPALVVSKDNDRRLDLVVCFIISVPREGLDMAAIAGFGKFMSTYGAMAAIAASPETGLKVPSVVRFDKIATLDRSVITGKLGDAPSLWLTSYQVSFFGVFGFGQSAVTSPSPKTPFS